MMVALLLYGYSRGVYSSRALARACEERVDFKAVTATNRPDFRTIADFRRRHLAALGALFVQVLELCRAAGLVQLGQVTRDGTKVAANASKHKAMSYARMRTAEQKLAAEVNGWFARAEAMDREEDRVHGQDARGDEMPDWVANKEARLAHPQSQGDAGSGGASAAAGRGRETAPAARSPRPVSYPKTLACRHPAAYVAHMVRIVSTWQGIRARRRGRA